MRKPISPWLLVATSSLISPMVLFGTLMGFNAWAENTELDAGPRAIPYNGILEFNGESFTGQADIQFTLTDDNQCVFTEDHEEVRVYAGRFSVNLGQPTGNLPACLFNAEAVFLEMAVRNANEQTPHVALAGRQRINPVPFSYWAAEGSDFRVDGRLRADRATIPNLEGNTNITGGLTVAQGANISNGMAVTGNTSFAGNASVGNKLFASTQPKGIHMPGGLNFGLGKEAWIQYNRDENGQNTALQLGVGSSADDALEFHQAGSVRMRYRNDKLAVTGQIESDTRVTAPAANINGHVNAQTLTTNNNATVGGDLQVNGNLNVTGNLINISQTYYAFEEITPMVPVNGRSACFLTEVIGGSVCHIREINGNFALDASPGNICEAKCLSW